jgi:hypothetical protein
MTCGYCTIALPDPQLCPECGNDPTRSITNEARWAVWLNRFGVSVAIGTLITQLIIKILGVDWIVLILLGESKVYFHRGDSYTRSLLDGNTQVGVFLLSFVVLLPTAQNVRVSRTVLLVFLLVFNAAISSILVQA